MSKIVQPLNQAGFAGFGDVIEHQGDQRQRTISIDFTHEHDDMRRVFWVSKVSEATNLPTQIKFLERHPFSDQAFVPLGNVRFLVITCSSHPDGNPNLDRICAYEAAPGQGVIYRKNVWHAPLSPLVAPAEFFVTMGVTDQAANDEFYELPAPLLINRGAQG